MGLYRSYFDYIGYVNKGHYFDLDMLETGHCELFYQRNYMCRPNHGLTEDEQIIAYTARAFFNSPIQLSCRLDKITEFELSLYCNEEIIAINQDGLYSAKPQTIIEQGDKIIHVMRKKLSNGDFAVAVFNLGKTAEWVDVYFDEVCAIRDVWAKKDKPAADRLVLNMHPHTVKVFRLTPKE